MNNSYVSKRYAVLSRFFKSLGLFTLICVMALSGANNVSAASPTRILVLGDSLSAGYGLPAGEAFPVKLGIKLRAAGHNVKMLNGGVSGDTSAGGRARLSWALADKPHFAIIELGANDGLRGLDPEAMRENLDDIITRLKAAGIGVLLTGMRAPPNIGPDYGKAFNRVFPDLAKKHHVLLYPFFLEGVAAIPELNQHDGIHPNPRGVAVIVDRIMPFVVRLLKDNQKAGSGTK
ncbi:MAG: arylesterase [Alphaproteobacteria bacterium]|jgi:acyl-CoA thioesterase-1